MGATPTSRIGQLTKAFLSDLRREFRIALTPVPTPQRWLFVVGCYNSGTTLLADLLGRHPLISGVPTEGQFLTRELPRDYDLGLPRMWVGREDLFRLDEASTGPDVERIKKEWGFRVDQAAPVIMEKSPPNAARTRWLQENFSPASFIGIVRNGYAVAEGIRRKAEPFHQLDGKWSIRAAAHQWARSNQILREDSAALADFTWVSYEDLTENPEVQLRRLFDFAGVGWDPQILMDENLFVHERSGPIENLNHLSIAKLSASDITAITEVAGSELLEFGYEIIGTPPATN